MVISVATSNDFPPRNGHLLESKMNRRFHPSLILSCVIIMR